MEYGTNPLNLDQTTVPIQSPEDTTITDMAYSTQISGLEEGTIYFFQVAAVYDVVFKRYSELAAFRTKETGIKLIGHVPCIHIGLYPQSKSSIFHSLSPLRTTWPLELWLVVMTVQVQRYHYQKVFHSEAIFTRVSM